MTAIPRGLQHNTIPGGTSEVVELPISGRGGTASLVLTGGRMFVVVDGGLCRERGIPVVGLFLRSETPSDAKL